MTTAPPASTTVLRELSAQLSGLQAWGCRVGAETNIDAGSVLTFEFGAPLPGSTAQRAFSLVVRCAWRLVEAGHGVLCSWHDNPHTLAHHLTKIEGQTVNGTEVSEWHDLALRFANGLELHILNDFSKFYSNKTSWLVTHQGTNHYLVNDVHHLYQPVGVSSQMSLEAFREFLQQLKGLRPWRLGFMMGVSKHFTLQFGTEHKYQRISGEHVLSKATGEFTLSVISEWQLWKQKQVVLSFSDGRLLDKLRPAAGHYEEHDIVEVCVTDELDLLLTTTDGLTLEVTGQRANSQEDLYVGWSFATPYNSYQPQPDGSITVTPNLTLNPFPNTEPA